MIGLVVQAVTVVAVVAEDTQIRILVTALFFFTNKTSLVKYISASAKKLNFSKGILIF